MVELIEHERKKLDTKIKADIEQTEWTWNDGTSIEVESHSVENPDYSIRYLEGCNKWVMILKGYDRLGNQIEFKIFSTQKPTENGKVI